MLPGPYGLRYAPCAMRSAPFPLFTQLNLRNCSGGIASNLQQPTVNQGLDL